MQVHFGLPGERLGPTALAVGSFDGLHLGHQALLDCLRRSAAEEALQPTLITFDPHPRCVLDPANCPPMITTLEERLDLARQLGGKGNEPLTPLGPVLSHENGAASDSST